MSESVSFEFSQGYINRLARNFGLSVSDFVLIVEFQQGCCPLCLRELGTDMRVDHDHYGTKLRNEIRRLRPPEEARKAVRGVLHHACNLLLGRLEEYPWLISEHVRAYLDKPPAQEALAVVEITVRSLLERRSRKPVNGVTRGGRRRIQHRTVDDVEQKWCEGCQDWHPLDAFNRKAKLWDGLAHRCRDSLNTVRRAQRSRQRQERGRI